MSWRAQAIQGGAKGMVRALRQPRLADGRPIFGPAVPLRPDEQAKLTSGVHDVEVEVLDLSRPEQKQRYAELLDGYYNRTLFFVRPPLEAYDPEIKNWRVLVRWGRTCAEVPIEKFGPEALERYAREED